MVSGKCSVWVTKWRKGQKKTDDGLGEREIETGGGMKREEMSRELEEQEIRN